MTKRSIRGMLRSDLHEERRGRFQEIDDMGEVVGPTWRDLNNDRNAGRAQGQTAQSALTAALQSFAFSAQNGDSVRLAELTDFEWSAVYRFGEGFTLESMETVVGTDVSFSDESRSLFSLSGWSALVFVDGDRVAETVVVASPLGLESDDDGPYTNADATVEVVDVDPGVSAQLALTND